MTYEVKRNYLEITSIHDLKENKKIYKDFTITLLDPVDFQLNKFFYKNIGKNYKWVDRLAWSETKWIDYVSNRNVKTFILKNKNDLVGFFESIFHIEKNEIEIAYFGVLEEYQNKKLGSYLLSEAIKKSFENDIKRVWLHTCSTDHKNALNNYIARGMKIFKSETVVI
jgi:ribosomal protein S18 acetylase RimI-like enzyme